MVKKHIESESEEEIDSDIEIAARDALENNQTFAEKFGQKSINNEDKLKERLKEI